MNYIDFAIAVMIFLVFFTVVLVLSTNYFTNISGLTKISEFRSMAEGFFNLFFGGKGIPEDWEQTSLSPVQIGLLEDLYRIPLIVRETSGYDRINEIVNVNLIFDENCENKAWNNTVRVFDENANEIYSKIYNQTFCSNQFLKQARIVWETNLTANQNKKFYVYYSSDDSIHALNYTNTFSTVGYWKFDENSGNITYDSSLYDNNGKLYNGTSWNSDEPIWSTDCKYGSCLEFDGDNDYVEIPDSDSLILTDAITIEAWVKSANSSGYNGMWQIVSKYHAYILGRNPNVGEKNICFIIYNGTNWYDFSNCYTPTNIDIWHNFVGTYDSSTREQKLYVDGVLRSTRNVTGAINPELGPIHIAHRENSPVGSDHFNGTIDEVRIWNRALSDEEINASYISGPIPIKLFPEEKLDTISSSKIEAMKGLDYEELIKTLGDYRFRIEISEKE